MPPVLRIGGDAGFELETYTLAAAIDQKVDFGAGVSSEEIEGAAGMLQFFERGNLLNHESFEAVAARGRGQQLIRGTDSEQVMKDAAIAQIDPSRITAGNCPASAFSTGSAARGIIDAI